MMADDERTTMAASLPVAAANLPFVAANLPHVTVDQPTAEEKSVVIEENIITYINPKIDKMMVNVGGNRHEVLTKMVAKLPETRLGQLALLHCQLQCEEYFFNRNPEVFNAVIDYYRSGELHVPRNICSHVIRRELEYWNLKETLIETCCWGNYSSHVDKVEALAILNAIPNDEQKENHDMLTKTGVAKVRLTAWRLISRPNSSIYAKAYSLVSMMFVMAAIFGCCLETMPELQAANHTQKFMTRACHGENETEKPFQRLLPVPIYELRVLDYICTTFFSVELLIRLVVAPKLLSFVKSPITIIDIIAIIPFYVLILFDFIYHSTCLQEEFVLLFQIIFILRVVRVFRVIQILAYYKPLKILIRALGDSIHELIILLAIVLICMLVFGTLAFFAEINHKDSSITTIPRGLWWAFVTITTVGYGDVFPRTVLGYFVGGACALCGTVLMALTIPILSNNFILYYAHFKTREQAIVKEQKHESELQQEEQYGAAKRSLLADGSIVINEPTMPDGSPDSEVLRHPSSLQKHNDTSGEWLMTVGDKENQTETKRQVSVPKDNGTFSMSSTI